MACLNPISCATVAASAKSAEQTIQNHAHVKAVLRSLSHRCQRLMSVDDCSVEYVVDLLNEISAIESYRLAPDMDAQTKSVLATITFDLGIMVEDSLTYISYKLGGANGNR